MDALPRSLQLRQPARHARLQEPPADREHEASAASTTATSTACSTWTCATNPAGYTLDLNLAKVNFKKFMTRTWHYEKSSGELTAQAHLTGAMGAMETMTGGGEVKIDNGDITQSLFSARSLRSFPASPSPMPRTAISPRGRASSTPTT